MRESSSVCSEPSPPGVREPPGLNVRPERRLIHRKSTMDGRPPFVKGRVDAGRVAAAVWKRRAEPGQPGFSRRTRTAARGRRSRHRSAIDLPRIDTGPRCRRRRSCRCRTAPCSPAVPALGSPPAGTRWRSTPCVCSPPRSGRRGSTCRRTRWARRTHSAARTHTPCSRCGSAPSTCRGARAPRSPRAWGRAYRRRRRTGVRRHTRSPPRSAKARPAW